MNTNAVIFVLSLIALSFLAVELYLNPINVSPALSTGAVSTGKVTFDDYVHVVIADSNGAIKLDEWDKNLVTNAGLGELGNILNGTHLNLNATWIALGNATNGAPLPTDTVLSGEFLPYAGSATACGLLNATGASIGQAQGAWNITKTFTSSCANLVVNATALYNSSRGGNGSPVYAGLTPLLFAEANFTQTTLQVNDQINVTWGIFITTSG